MLNEQTTEKLYAMKLNGMAVAFKEQLQKPDLSDLSFSERFSLMVDQQWSWKEDRRMKRLLSNAKLKISACVEDIDDQANFLLIYLPRCSTSAISRAFTTLSSCL